VNASLAPQGQVELAVTDEGPGIPAQSRGQVFDRFFRVPGTQSFDPRRKGVGVGLSIARDLCVRSGGDIHLRDALIGQGACFEVELPAAAR
jgi:signal transduction histidine kinase